MINLATQRKYKSNTISDLFMHYPANFESFIRTGAKSSVGYKRNPVFENENTYDFVLDENGALYEANLRGESGYKFFKHDFLGMILSDKNCLKKKYGFKYTILQSGDSSTQLAAASWNMPTISFFCLARFFGEDISSWQNPKLDTVIKLFQKNHLIVVDYRPDTRKNLTKKEQELFKNNKNKIIPPVGFTLIYVGYSIGESSYWHRSGAVLVKDTRKNGKSILLGQDEGTYFGCELQDHPKTIEEAFISLMPSGARGKKGVLRQGEWFAVPVSEKDVIKRSESIGFISGLNPIHVMILPIEHEDSNEHELKAQYIRIAKDGTVFARNFILRHDEHKEIAEEAGWYKFIKNTALRSFSQEGVD